MNKNFLFFDRKGRRNFKQTPHKVVPLLAVSLFFIFIFLSFSSAVVISEPSVGDQIINIQNVTATEPIQSNGYNVNLNTTVKGQWDDAYSDMQTLEGNPCGLGYAMYGADSDGTPLCRSISDVAGYWTNRTGNTISPSAGVEIVKINNVTDNNGTGDNFQVYGTAWFQNSVKAIYNLLVGADEATISSDGAGAIVIPNAFIAGLGFDSGNIFGDISNVFNLQDSSQLTSIDVVNRILYANDGSTSLLNWGTSTTSIEFPLAYGIGISYGIDLNNGALLNSGGKHVDWINYLLKTSSGSPETEVSSIDWSNRRLYDTDGASIVASWGLGTQTFEAYNLKVAGSFTDGNSNPIEVSYWNNDAGYITSADVPTYETDPQVQGRDNDFSVSQTFQQNITMQTGQCINWGNSRICGV